MIRVNSYTYISVFVDSVLMLYFALVRSELEFASVAWNSVTY
jgi:hypothetical protein